MWRKLKTTLERDIVSHIWGLRGITQLLLNFVKLYNTDLIALNEFVKNALVYTVVRSII